MLAALGAVTAASCVTADASGPELSQVESFAVGTTFKWVDTMLNLMALPTQPTPPEEVLVLKAYLAPQDGGGGVFVWDANATAAMDFGTVIRPNDRAANVAGRWRRLFSGALNVRWFGAQGNDSNTDQVNINLAIAAANARGNGEVYLPPGIYRTFGSIVLDKPAIRLFGDGAATAIRPATGGFHTIVISSRWNEVSNLDFYEELKTSGRTIEAVGAADLKLVDLSVLGPWEGIHLHNYNHVEIDRVGIRHPRSPSGYGFWLSGGGSLGDGVSHVISFRDSSVEGLLFVEGPHGDRHGLIIDGNVHTVSVSKLYILAMQGCGVWFRNAVGTAAEPNFASFYGLEVDFPQFEGIRIDHGKTLHFTDTMVHGSAERTNIAIGVEASNRVAGVTFKGGFSSGARLSGIDIWGTEVAIAAMYIHNNSGIARGNAASGAAGIEIRGPARRVAITGNTIGDEGFGQAYGVRMAATANFYTVVGNDLSRNVGGGVFNAPGPLAGQREIVANLG